MYLVFTTNWGQKISILFAIINNKKCIHNQSRCIFGSVERPLLTFIIILLEGKFREKSKTVKCPKTDMSGKGFVAVCVASIESKSTFRNDFARHVRFVKTKITTCSTTKCTKQITNVLHSARHDITRIKMCIKCSKHARADLSKNAR